MGLFSAFKSAFQTSDSEEKRKTDVLKVFEKEIQTWEKKPAQAAVGIVDMLITGREDSLEQLYGKGAKPSMALQEFTVGQMRFVMKTLHELDPEQFEA